MPTQTRVVRLLQNHIYPTYQLYATMTNPQTIPADGLRLAALTTMEWLRQRMGENAPSELIQSAIAAHQPGIRDRHCIPTTGGGVEPANHRTGPGVGARKPKPAAAGRAGSDH